MSSSPVVAIRDCLNAPETNNAVPLYIAQSLNTFISLTGVAVAFYTLHTCPTKEWHLRLHSIAGMMLSLGSAAFYAMLTPKAMLLEYYLKVFFAVCLVNTKIEWVSAPLRAPLRVALALVFAIQLFSVVIQDDMEQWFFFRHLMFFKFLYPHFITTALQIWYAHSVCEIVERQASRQIVLVVIGSYVAKSSSGVVLDVPICSVMEAKLPPLTDWLLWQQVLRHTLQPLYQVAWIYYLICFERVHYYARFQEQLQQIPILTFIKSVVPIVNLSPIVSLSPIVPSQHVDATSETEKKTPEKEENLV